MSEHAFTPRHDTVPYYLGLRLISGAAAQALLMAKFGIALKETDALALRQTAALIDPATPDTIDTGVDRREPALMVSDATLALGRAAIESDDIPGTLGETAATLAAVAGGKTVDQASLDMANDVVRAIHDTAAWRRALEQQNPFSEL